MLSRLARASWIEIKFLLPRFSVTVQSRLARASWIEIPGPERMSGGLRVEARKSLVDRNYLSGHSDIAKASRLARASWIEIMRDVYMQPELGRGSQEPRGSKSIQYERWYLSGTVEARKSLVDRNWAATGSGPLSRSRGSQEPRGSKFPGLSVADGELSRGSQEPRGSKFPPLAACSHTFRSRLARASWIEIFP